MVPSLHQQFLWKIPFFLFHYIFSKLLEAIGSFRGATDTPLLDFWWHLSWVSKPGWIPFCVHSHLCDPQIPLVWHLLTGVTPADCIEVSMAAVPFWTTTCRSVHKHWRRFGLGIKPYRLCGDHSALYHSATPAQLGHVHTSSITNYGSVVFIHRSYFLSHGLYLVTVVTTVQLTKMDAKNSSAVELIPPPWITSTT